METNLVQLPCDLGHVVLLCIMFEVQRVHGHDLPLPPLPLVAADTQLADNKEFCVT